MSVTHEIFFPARDIPKGEETMGKGKEQKHVWKDRLTNTAAVCVIMTMLLVYILPPVLGISEIKLGLKHLEEKVFGVEKTVSSIERTVSNLDKKIDSRMNGIDNKMKQMDQRVFQVDANDKGWLKDNELSEKGKKVISPEITAFIEKSFQQGLSSSEIFDLVKIQFRELIDEKHESNQMEAPYFEKLIEIHIEETEMPICESEKKDGPPA